MVPGLKSVIKNTPGFNRVILVWDDYVREQPIDFAEIEDQVGHKITVVKHTDLDPWPEKIGQWGWIKQQLVKLRCHEYSSADYTWIVDGDVLVVDNPELFIENKPALRYDQDKLVDFDSSEYHDFITKYFGIKNFIPNTWVGSTCLFDNNICQEIWDVCAQLNNKTLTECVDETISTITDIHAHWPLSEFELYGSYCYSNYKEKFYITEKNWNYGIWNRPRPNATKLSMPIQIMWQHFDKDIIESLTHGLYKN